MYPSNFHTSQSTNKMAANDGRPKLIIRNVQTIINANTGNAIKNILMRGVEGD